MSNRSFSFITFSGVLILAMACSGENPAGPNVSAPDNQNGPLSSAIKSDIAAAAGNAIATDLETLIANEAAAVGSFARFFPTPTLAFDGESSSPAPADSTHEEPRPATPPDSAHEQPKPPAPADSAHEQSKPPAAEPQPSAPPAVSESCSFNADALVYSCAKTGEGRSVLKSYQFLDASGAPMEKFVRGTTESIHYLVKSDESAVKDNGSSVSHSLRDVTVSGFLGPNRIWNGFGSSADTSTHREELTTRRYAGLSVDTLKAVTFVDERATHPYPLSGVAIRVVDYAVVSTGTQAETTSVHKRVVVTFNGTADVPISLGDYSCVLHLDTHKVDGCK